jgi:stringent starvation protein B
MSDPTAPEGTEVASTRPYLIRALHDWCTDNGFTPYLAVYVDESVQVPREYVKNHEIVLNVSFDATSGLKLGNDTIEFRARFGGVSRDIFLPVDHVIAIYARENGQGMAFPVPVAAVAGDPGAEGGGGEGEAAPRLAGPRTAPGPLKLAPGPGTAEPPSSGADEPPEPTPPGGGRPALKRVK